ncbi:hypothetical protein [Homoserinimonas hongtaonis]|uniref:Uncharacterized protein n=1 Tax=Homoserinimonas hongtaonis TaxID=2079791 RepID=A0A2U1SXX3_9MICO|nr:hypothetical protein [Salinibacterium hongtaonis]PWB96480.1 hypothetical protein DF220_00435 [Salinibacterium hongtaonis]
MPGFAWGLALVVGVAVIVFVAARRAAFHSVAIAEENLPAAEAASRYFRRRSVFAITATVLFSVGLGTLVLFAIRATGPMTLMNPLHWLLLSPLLIGIVGVASFSFVPRFREAGNTRSAELVRRTPFTFGSRRVFFAPVAAAAILVALIVWFGVVSDSEGLIVVGDRLGYIPGFFYGGPLLAGVVLLAGISWLSVRHVASVSRPTDASLRAADAAVRLVSIRIILSTATAAVLATAGSILVMAGSTAHSMAQGSRFAADGTESVADATVVALGVWGTVGIWAAIACFVATVVFIVAAVSDATRTPFEAAAAKAVVL